MGGGSPSYESPQHADRTGHDMCGPSVTQALDFDDPCDGNQSFDNKESSWLASISVGLYNDGLIPRFIEQSVATPTVPHKVSALRKSS